MSATPISSTSQPASQPARRATKKQQQQQQPSYLSCKASSLPSPSKDATKLLSYCQPGCSAVRMRGTELLVETLEQLCRIVEGMEGELWEGLVEPRVEVHKYRMSVFFLFWFLSGWREDGDSRGGEISLGELLPDILCREFDLRSCWSTNGGRSGDPSLTARQVYHDLATVWAKNEIKIDGTLAAVGCNVISLHRMVGEWRITGIADTSHSPPAAEE
jgi:hypothetical protein